MKYCTLKINKNICAKGIKLPDKLPKVNIKMKNDKTKTFRLFGINFNFNFLFYFLLILVVFICE